MWDCQIQKWHVDKNDPKNVSKRFLDWVVTPVSEVPLDTKNSSVRCRHCHGPVKVHRKKKPTGIEDHVEHKAGKNVEHCLGYYKFVAGSEHQMSSNPVI
jgi:hypothetical protein